MDNLKTTQHCQGQRTLYVSDMDGTLLDNNSQLSPTTVQALNRVVGDMEGLFTVATARTPATVVPLMSEVHATLPFIVMGGAAMWNPATHAFEQTRPIAESTLNAIGDVFEQHGLTPFIYRRHDNLLVTHHCGSMSAQEQAFVAQRQGLPLKRFVLDDSDWRHSPDEALLIFSMNSYARLSAVAHDVQQQVDCTVTLYHDIFDDSNGYLEIYTDGTTKAAAIRRLARQVGATRVVVFGDNRNDIAMMQAADHSVAVENAFPEVKAVASQVIGPNTADSVALWIEQDLKQASR